MQMLVHTGLLYFVEKMKLFILIVLVLNMFLKKLKNSSVMCGYFCIGFIDFMLAGTTLTDFTSLFPPYDFEKNGSIILSYLKINEIDKTNLTDQKKIQIK